MRQERPRFVNPEGLADPSRYYSHAVVASPGARLAYIAGQYAADESGRIVSDDYAEQVRRAFANLRIALHAIGAKGRVLRKLARLQVGVVGWGLLAVGAQIGSR